MQNNMKIHISMQGMDAIKVVAIAFAITFSAFLVYSKFGILLSDEGFLWYGMMSTSLGEVPIRDFQAYDPARYYWGVLWFKLLASDGPTALRTTFMLVEWVAVTLSLLILRRLTKSWVLLITWGLIIHAWMYVHFKIFDTAVAIMAIYIALLLLEKPGLYRYFGAGVFVGFSAFVGINHGLYNTLSFSLLILFIWFKFDRELLIRKYMVWGSGIVIGYSPMLLMFVFPRWFFWRLPGFSDGVVPGWHQPSSASAMAVDLFI